MKTKLFKLVSLLLCMSILCSFTAAAAESTGANAVEPRITFNTYDSSERSLTADGNSYRLSTTFYYYQTYFKVGAWAITDKDVPGDTIYLKAYLLDKNKDVVVASNETSNDGAIYFHFVDTKSIHTSDTQLYGYGTVKIRHQDGVTETFSRTPTLYYDDGKIQQVADLKSLRDVKTLPTNTQGLTYGSIADADHIEDLDLISAVGVDGVRGYVRRWDFAPSFASAQAEEVYYAALKEDNLIPLYDLNGKQIGQFALDVPSEEKLDPTTEQRINDLKNNAPENDTLSVSPVRDNTFLGTELSETLRSELVNGTYPKNNKGETYGSIIMESIVGAEPDLISVVGDKGIPGYIRNSAQRHAVNGTVLDVQDLDGNVIDTFTFVSQENQVALGQAERVPDDVIEEYIDVDINSPYSGPDFYIELNSIAEGIEKTSGDGHKDNTVALHQADNIPENVVEEYIDPVEVEEGVYEYRDSEGTLLTTMYEDPSKMSNTLATSAKMEYSIDLDVAAGSWAHTDDMINQSGIYKIIYSIDFARELPAYLGRYYKNSSGQDRVAWMNHIYSKGIYASFTESGSPFYVAIKNMRNKSNIYTGTVTVS